MKKILISVLSILMLCSILGCAKKNETIAGSITEVTAQDLIDKFENNETFFFFVAQTTCPHCKEYIEFFNSYVQDNALNMYYVEADASENEGTFDTLMKTYIPDVDETPTTYFVKEGKVIDSVEGDMKKDAFNTWLTRLDVTLPLES